MAVFAARIDGDADLDLVSVSFNDSRVAWYENNGPSPTWPMRDISLAADLGEDMTAADMDGDGDTDVLSTSSEDRLIFWHENDGASPPGPWVGRVLATNDNGTTVHAADVDGDGDQDVVSSGWFYENNGATPPAFTQRLFATSGAAISAVFVADVDGDGDADIVAASSQDDRITWYANSGGSPPVWTPRVISTSADFPLGVHGGDLDLDGDFDVVSASFEDNKVSWYENHGGPAPAWTEHVITTSTVEAWPVYAADVDADSDIDVISAGLGRLVLHVNDSFQPTCAVDQDCNDPLFCNGIESCGAAGTCEPGLAACTPSDFCRESEDRCVDCVIGAHCSDGLFCNGGEICDGTGTCQPGTSMCSFLCRESDDRCVMCLSAADCADDGLFCNGTPTCNQNGNCATGGPPCPPGTCSEATDTCVTGAPQLWVSFDGTVTVPDGVGTVQNEDVVAWNTATGLWSLLFDGSDVGLASAAIGGLARLPNGDLLLSFTAPFNVPGLTGGPSGTSVDDSDIVRFTPMSVGTNTTGSFSFYFDGSDVGLTTNQETIDAIDVAADGRLVLSTTGAASANGAAAEDEDLLIFTASGLGSVTAGTFALRFDGSDVGLSANDEDLDAACDTVAGALLLSTLGSFSVTGASGPDEDVLRFTPSSLGANTAGSYAILLDTSTEGIATSADVSAVELKE
jgi:hypothetical protein